MPAKSALQQEIDRAAKVPGPGQYNVRPRPSSRGVVFDEGSHVTNIEAEALRRRDMPVRAAVQQCLRVLLACY